jgi:hypothetical protein
LTSWRSATQALYLAGVPWVDWSVMPWQHLEHIHDDQADRAADGGIGPVARPEHVAVGVHADVMHHRPGDHQEMR